MSEAVDLERRFGGLARLYGLQGAKNIRSAHVVVVGIGGVGSWAAEALARSGIARLTLIDLDHIAESNINRQIHALGSTLGQSKVQAMRDRIADINPECHVRCVEEFVDTANWPGVAGMEPGHQVAVLDACDQVKAKTAIAAWALQQRINFITVGAAGGKRHAHKVEVDDMAATTHDPLLAQLRYRLRKEHGVARQGKLGINCVFSRESVMQPVQQAARIDTMQTDALPVVEVQTDSSLNCHGYGSVVSVTATFGICAAGWLLDKIADPGFAKYPKITL